MANIFQDLKNTYRVSGLIQRLIFWIIGVSVVLLIIKVFSPKVYGYLIYWLALSSNWLPLVYKPWTLLSYSFLHAGVIHLIFNMIMLFFVGQLFTTFFNQKHFITCYFAGAVMGGVFYLIGSSLVNVGPVLVGASAAIIAPLIALVCFRPHMQIKLLLIGQVKIWYIAAFIIILDIIQLSGSNIGGHLAHLGGAFMGYLFIVLYKRGIDLSVILDKLSAFFSRKEKTKFTKVYRNTNRVNKKDSSQEQDTQQQIDKILEKISKSGYESLTKQEKDFLFTAGKK
ncbi:rhomboid family intramembrane serine protease [Myroides sp. LJL119]